LEDTHLTVNPFHFASLNYYIVFLCRTFQKQFFLRMTTLPIIAVSLQFVMLYSSLWLDTTDNNPFFFFNVRHMLFYSCTQLSFFHWLCFSFSLSNHFICWRFLICFVPSFNWRSHVELSIINIHQNIYIVIRIWSILGKISVYPIQNNYNFLGCIFMLLEK